MACVDFSNWNDMPWWNRKGYKTRDEAWANANLSSMCELSPAQLRAVEERGIQINRDARSARNQPSIAASRPDAPQKL